ncbi:MAG: hypothetical protein EOO20_26515 [Chryseobacterium sp.]|nr:MAG: hypothetical protein EOO20_26515 [Chryseobacterium sp.]
MKDILDFVLHDEEIKSYVQDRKLAFLESELGYAMHDQDDELNTKIIKIEYLLLNRLLIQALENISQNDTPERHAALIKEAFSVISQIQAEKINVLEKVSAFAKAPPLV